MTEKLKLYKYLLPPIYPDLEKSHKAGFLHYASFIVGIAFLIFGFLNIGWGAINLGVTFFVFSVICVGGFIFNIKKRYYLSASLLCAIIFIGIFYNLIDGAAFNDPGIAALPVFIILAGYLFRKAYLPFFTFLPILAVFVIYGLWNQGLLKLNQDPTVNRLIILTILQIATGFLSRIISSTYQNTILKLNLSEKRYRDLVENINDLVYRYEFTPIQRFSYVSPSSTRIIGYTPEEHYQDPELGYKLIHPDDHHILDSLYDKDTDFNQPIRLRWIRKDGSILWTEQINTPFFDENGTLIAIEGVARDINDRVQAEIALRESAERNRAFFEESPLLNWRFSLDPPLPINLPVEEQIDWILHKSKLTDVNLGFALVERPFSDDPLGKTLYHHWGQMEDYGKDTILSFIEGGYSLRMYETKEYTSTGELVWSIINAFGVIEEDQLTKIWGTTLDITDQKKAEEELRESETRLRNLIDTLPVSFVIHADEEILYMNPIGLTLFGASQLDEMVGRSVWDMIPPESEVNARSRLDSLYTRRQIARMEHIRFRKLTGEIIDTETLSVPVVYKGKKAAQAVIFDITDRKKADDSLRASEDRYRTLFEHAAEGISIHAGDKFIDVNKAWEDIFGRSKSEVIGHTPFDYSPSIQPDGEKSEEKGWRLINQAKAGEEQRFEWRHQRSDGTEFDVEIFMTVIDLSGEDVMISFVRDLTERREAEAAARDERQRLARELHDAVSQTLFSANTIAQTLERSWEKNPELVRHHLNELQILTLGALAEMRTLLLELRPGALEHISMVDLLSQLVDGFSGRSKTKIELLISGDHPLPFDIRYVFFRLVQEVFNNIIKHARADHVEVSYDSQPDRVQLIIEDNGRGFDPTNIEPGHHGLAIMKERAKAIQADLQITSQPGKGTSVSLHWRPREVLP